MVGGDDIALTTSTGVQAHLYCTINNRAAYNKREISLI